LTGERRANPFLAGAAGRCPNCGKGPLFAGFLGINPVCPVCGFDLAASDSGDGPAVFVILVVGFLMVFAVLFADIAFNPPIWVLLATSIPLAGLMCLALLRPMKGLMIAAQIRNKASQHRRDETP
jgi:uncharacterized protein (DUF983 family)